MKLEDKVNQLTDLMADLIPTVDRLSKTVDDIQGLQKETNVELNKLSKTVMEGQKLQKKANVEFHEMRLSNMKLAEAIYKLTKRIDKTNNFEKRINRLEKQISK